MAIYRGPGGAGDATNDATSQAIIAVEAAVAAALSETAAEASAVSAASSASEAATSATNAYNSATSADASATNAANSALSAADSAATATTKASEASASATAAASSATSAATSATNASNSATSAASSASTATTKAAEASTSATAAAASATAAATSESNADISEANAASSATAAASSATSAAASATSATNSASTATTQATNAASSASAAATSASNAATSETNAASSATSAASSASTAIAQATNAASSATSAASSATSAANSAASAAAALDNFDDRYLGAYATDPTTDNDGNPLIVGALYFNSVSNKMRTYDGTDWIDAVSASQNSVITYEYVATAGQTTFSGADANAEVLAYTEGLIEVQINGLVLRPGDDYTATTGTSVVLTSAAAVGDEVQIDAYSSFTMADSANPTFTGTATFPSIIENASIVASGSTGTINFNAKTNSVLYYTNNASGNFTLNIRGDASTSLNATIPTGKVMTMVFINTNGSTPYYLSGVQIDGTSVTPKWQGGSAPNAGNIGIDIYTLAVIKTADNTYTVLGSLTGFA